MAPLMGQKHRDRVWGIPPGYLTPDERLVLLVLADMTKDDRQEWAHDRDKVMPMMGLDPDLDSDHEWLRRRLADLEEAGFIKRRRQRRETGEKGQPGTWHRVSIKLEDSFAGSPGFDLIYGGVEPTRRAARGDKRAQNLPAPDDRPRDEAGRFAPAHAVGGVASHAVGGVEPHSVGGVNPTELVELDRTTGHIPDLYRTVDGLAVERALTPSEEAELEERKAKARADLAELAARWSSEDDQP